MLDNVVSQQWATLLDRTLSGSQLDLEISRRQTFQNTGQSNGSINDNMRMSGEQTQSPSTSVYEHVTEV